MKTTSLIILALGVCASAFGAHAVKNMVTPDRLDVFKTGANYQIIMSLTLFCLTREDHIKPWVLNLLFAGILLFSFSLYALVLLDMPKFGMITPIGGASMIIAIVFAAIQVRAK